MAPGTVTALRTTLLPLLVAVAGAAAQAPPPGGPPAWARLAVPAGVAASSLSGQGKLVVYRAGTALSVFSSATRAWHTTTTSPNAPMRLCNDCLVVVEPTYCRAFASHTGAFVDVSTGPTAAVLNSGGNRNDSILLVGDQGQLHAFSAFSGAWTTRAVGPGYGVSVQRHVAVVADGNVLGGLSAFAGGWHDVTTTATIVSLDADGTAAIASDGVALHGFSAHTGQWRSVPAPSGANAARSDDWALWYGAGRVLAYSGLTGEFAARSFDVATVAAQSDLFALLSGPTGLVAWSAVTGTFSATQRDAPIVEAGGAVALLHDGAGTRGYSALRQQFTALAETSAASGVGTSVAFVTSHATGEHHAFSASSATWHRAPSGTAASTPLPTTTTIGFATATETYAFASGSGAFVPLGAPVTGLSANPTSAPLLGYDGNQLVAFDDRLGRWVTTPRTGFGQPVFAIWRTSALVVDGLVAHGIGAQAGRWRTTTLPSPTANAYANSEVVYVATPNAVDACAMLPELVTFAQFPYFRRVQPLAAPVRQSLVLAPGSVAVVALGALAAPSVVPGIGTLALDPNAMFAQPALPAAGAAHADVVWQLPVDPSLVGLRLGTQALVWASNGALHLDEPGTIDLW